MKLLLFASLPLGDRVHSLSLGGGIVGPVDCIRRRVSEWCPWDKKTPPERRLYLQVACRDRGGNVTCYNAAKEQQ